MGKAIPTLSEGQGNCNWVSTPTCANGMNFSHINTHHHHHNVSHVRVIWGFDHNAGVYV